MITKQTTQVQRTYRNSGAAQSWRKLAGGVGLAAGALLIVLALLAGRAAAPVSESRPSDTAVRPAAIDHNVPIQHTWSAYDGQAGPARVAASLSTQVWPGTTLMGSAYDGQANRSTRLNASSSVQSWSGAMVMGSAYDGQTASATRLTARPVTQVWPGATLMGSAYDGQTNNSLPLSAPTLAVTVPVVTGLIYDGTTYRTQLIRTTVR
jgi:hypothetical protein